MFPLSDIIGLVTAVSSEKKYVKSGNVTRKIELELTDDKYCDCDLRLLNLFVLLTCFV